MKDDMKQTILTIAMALAFAGTVNAQSLYQKVHDNATAVVNNAASNDQQIQVNQFKITARNFIMTQVSKHGQTKTDYFYDSQAVNLASFITDFETDVIKANRISPAKRLAVIECYRNASLQNPLFGDTDKETAYCYVNDTKTYTPFSLDTDWEKAYAQASAQIKEILK